MNLDCDDAMLLISSRGGRTLTGVEATHLHEHLAECTDCRTLDNEAAEHWRWVARMPQDAFDDPDLLVFPVVDPIVFQAGKVLASGGMGRITRVTDRRLGREVALKESLEGTLRPRFEREAAITARLQHPSIVPIYEAGSWPDGSLFFTMRLVEGDDLAVALGRTKTLPERIALLPHVIKVTEALAYAHARKVIHRDLKPANVLVGPYGETVVIDWGIAKELGRVDDDSTLPTRSTADGLTHHGVILGTPCFMPPEQARGEAIDQRTDVYALGALLYNVLVGEPPYWDRFKSSEVILEYSLLHPPTPIRELAPGAPEDLCTIVERAMARAPADRYRDAGEMADELRRFEAGQLIARAYTLRELVTRWLARHRTSVVITAIAAAVLAVVAVVAVINVRSSRDAEVAARRDAESNLDAARVSAAVALEDQARVEILGGERARGLTYAAAAYAQGRDSTSLRYLLAVASRDAVRHLSEIGPPALTTSCGAGEYGCAGNDVEALAYDRDGNLVMVEVTGRISTWRDGTLMRSSRLPKHVNAAAIDPAVKRAAVLLEPTMLSMWDLATGKQLWSVVDPTLEGLATSIAFDSTGRHVIATSDNDAQRAIALRDAATGGVIQQLVVGKREITAAAFSPDGSRIAACDPNGAVKVWTISPFAEIASWTADPEPQMLVFVGNDRIAIDSSIAPVRTVSIWELARTPRLVKLLTAHRGPNVTLAADGNALVTSDDELLRLWDRDGDLVAESRAARSRFDQVVFTPTAIVGAALDSRVFIFERETLVPRAIFAAHNSTVAILALDAKRTKIASAGDSDQRVHEWSMPPGSTLLHTPGTDGTWFGDRLAVASPTGLVFYRADGTADGRIELGLGERATVAAAGDHLIASGTQGQYLIDRARTVRALPETTALVPSRDGRYALADDDDSEPPEDGLRVWDLAKGELVRTIKQRNSGAAIVGDNLVVTSGRRISIVEITTGRKLANTQLPPTDAYRLDVSASGKSLIASNLKRMIVIEPTTGRELAVLDSPSDVNELMIAADDQLILASTDSGTWAWDLPSGKRLAQIDHQVGFYAVSADGMIAIADRSRVRIVSRATARQLDAIDVVTDSIRRVAFNADGSRLMITTASVVVMLDVHRETRDPTAIDALANQLPWKIEQGVAVPK